MSSTSLRAPTREDAAGLDARDPLASYRDRFVCDSPSDGVLAYLDGNSLGRLPRTTVERLHEVVQHEWGGRLIRSWQETWLRLPRQVGDLIGSAVLGAAPGQVVVADSTSVCLFKALHAAAGLRPGRTVLVAADTDFPTDRYVLQAVAEQRGMAVRWLAPDPDGGVDPGVLEPALGDDVAVVALSHVDYRSAYVADLVTVTAMTHAAGAVTVWDLSHSAGSVPVGLDAATVDLAVGCTYKYLNGGPGAPAYLYAATRHHGDLKQPVPGWFGAADVFAMAADFTPATGIEQMLSGTPSVLGLIAVREGVRLVADAGMVAIAAKATGLTELAIALADAWLGPLGVTLVSPRDPVLRGAHLVLRHPEARRWSDQLAADGVIGDFRNPDLWRIGLSPLSTSYFEVWTAMDTARTVLAELMEERS
ncbi:MAG: aminotransferase class V-fold PLP-dependent enzyme [Nocardioidaceae bacterium]|nr:aminotransferase class V-fold PLP-dependent enzyme [Nocardioidaceae bacterium]